MYDFANSAFATSVLSVIFSVYFANVLVPHEGILVGPWRIPGESLWGYLISFVMFFVIVLSPTLGALADQQLLKRFLLLLWATVGAFCTMGLVWAAPGRLALTMALVFFAVLGFEMSLVFYNAFLKDIVSDEAAGRVSGLGFALGYIGGGLCLALNMVMLNRPEMFGFSGTDKTLPVRVGMMVVGGWWFLFSIPIFLWVKDAGHRTASRYKLNTTLRQLKETFRSMLSNRPLARFLLAFVIYDDGVQTVILMASIFGAKALGMSTGQLALCFLMIQFVAFIGALVCGRLADSWSHKKVILITLAIYVGVICWGVFMTKIYEFWILGAVVGLVLGGTQAASRSLFALMIPADKSSEYFALFSIIGKAGSFLGPLVFGVVSQFFGLRVGVGSLMIFFLVGGGILFGVIESPSSYGNKPKHV